MFQISRPEKSFKILRLEIFLKQSTKRSDYRFYSGRGFFLFQFEMNIKSFTNLRHLDRTDDVLCMDLNERYTESVCSLVLGRRFLIRCVLLADKQTNA